MLFSVTPLLNLADILITGLSLNGNQMLVGKLNDQPSFWIDGDQKNCMDEHLSTPQITFKNGEVLSSYCKGTNTEV